MKNKMFFKVSALIMVLLMLVSVFCALGTFAADENTYDLGDVDLNTRVNIKDATLIRKFLASLRDLSEEQKALADMDSNGRVSIKDATCIQKFIAGIVEEQPPLRGTDATDAGTDDEAEVTEPEIPTAIETDSTETVTAPAATEETETESTVPETSSQVITEPQEPTEDDDDSPIVLPFIPAL